MPNFRNWLVGIVLEAMKRRDEQIDAELAQLRGAGGQVAADRYAQLKDGRIW